MEPQFAWSNAKPLPGDGETIARPQARLFPLPSVVVIERWASRCYRATSAHKGRSARTHLRFADPIPGGSVAVRCVRSVLRPGSIATATATRGRSASGALHGVELLEAALITDHLEVE